MAYFISFRTYGTWLHGDERGSVDRVHNQYGTPFLPPDEDWHRQDEQLLEHTPVVLTQDQRRTVELAIRETCVTRNWILRALNVRTNHVHVVVSTNTRRPELALNAFKTKATRRLRRLGYWPHTHSPWSDKGSKRYLWTEAGVHNAINYVLNGQEHSAVGPSQVDSATCD